EALWCPPTSGSRRRRSGRFVVLGQQQPDLGTGFPVQRYESLLPVPGGRDADKIYTRISAKNNADNDVILWNTTLEYLDMPTSEKQSQEAWGPLRYKWVEKDEQRVIGQFYAPWTAPARGDVTITVEVEKDPTTD